MALLNIVTLSILTFTCLCCVNNVAASAGLSWESVFKEHYSPVIPLRYWGGKSYYVSSHILLSWYDAVSFCKHIHMELMTISSHEENEQIFNFIRDAGQGFDYWTSGTRIIDGNKWVWFLYGEMINYTNWSRGQPGNPNAEKCLQVWKRGEMLEWNDRSCDIRFHFICERYDTQNAVLPAGHL